MTASPDHELAALRARAYGPHADIETDPVALARLRALEEAERAARRDAPPTAASVETPVAAVVVEGTAASDARTESVSPADPGADAYVALGLPVPDGGPRSSVDTPARAPRPIAAAWVVAWAASVLLVALIVGGMVFGLASIRPVSTATGATQVASLTEPVDAPEWLSQWFPQGADSLAFSYQGLVVARAPGGLYGGGADSRCLFVADADAYQSDGMITGQVFTGCGVSAFPATVQFVVDASSTEQLRETFAEGTALQFVLSGDMVGVFAIDAPQPTATVVAER